MTGRRVGPIRPYGDTTGDGMVQLSFTLPMPHSKVAEGAAAQLANKMGMDPALVVHAKPMGQGFTFFVVYGRVNHLVDPSKVEVVERDYPLLTPKEANAAIKRGAAPPAGRRGRLHRHRRPHRRHRRDPQHQGVRGGEGPGVLPRAQGREPRRPGLACPSSSSGPARRRPTPCWSPRSSPSATPTCSTPARCRRRSASPTRADRRPLLIVGGPRFDETMAGELGVDRVFTRGTTPGEVASFLVHRLADRKAIVSSRIDRHEVGTRVVHRRYVPVLPRPLRRQPGRRRLQPRPVRRRGHRDVHPSPTATRACSRRTPTCSSGRRSGPATSSRSPASWSGSAPARGPWTSPSTWSPAAPPTEADPGAADDARRAGAGHHGDRHGGRPAAVLSPSRLTGLNRRRRVAGRHADGSEIFDELPATGRPL